MKCSRCPEVILVHRTDALHTVEEDSTVAPLPYGHIHLTFVRCLVCGTEGEPPWQDDDRACIDMTRVGEE